VQNFLIAYGTALGVLRIALFALALLVAAVCAVDWAVRTRRVSPFGPVARFFRASVDPLIAPIERRVVRGGGLPANAPWWALAAVVVGGIVLLSLLNALHGWIYVANAAFARGPRGIYFLLVTVLVGLLQIALLVRVVSSWVRISPYSRWVRWSFVLTEPILAPLRRVIPPLGMVDVTPIVAYLLINYVLAPLLLGFA
jgi:YggT family protein